MSVHPLATIARARPADHTSHGLRRGLQVALGVLWLLDAALQSQPAMFTHAFPATVIAPAAAGQPGIVAGPVLLSTRLIAAYPPGWNAAFAAIQFALGTGLLLRVTTRVALAGTIAWGLGLWWLGEGLGGILGGTASPLSGAPGAALLYALLAAIIWPVNDYARPVGSIARTGPLGRYAVPAWLALWIMMVTLLLTAPDSAAGLTSGGGLRARLIVIAFATAFALAAIGILAPALTRTALVVAVTASLALWAFGEHFGSLLSGQATDPNTGPLLVLLVLAFWPLPSASGNPNADRQRMPHGVMQ